MKRMATWLTLTALLLAVAPAQAAGGIAASEQTWYAVRHSDDYRVYFYARVENEGTETETINNLLFEVRDAQDTTIESTARYKLYPETLMPGQAGYLAITQDVKDVESRADIDHCALTITSKKKDDQEIRRLPATAEYLAEDEDENEDVLRARVENPFDRNAFSITAAMVARDDAGNLLYVTGTSTGSLGLPQGGALLVREEIKSEIMDAIEDAGAQIADVEALAYTAEDLDD